jgi:hypothetical protein
MKRPWEDENRRPSPESRLGVQIMSDGAGSRSHPPQLHKVPSPSNMLPPIVAAPEQSTRLFSSDRLPSGSTRPLHVQQPPDGASKRPRLHYDMSFPSESMRAPALAQGPPAKMPLDARDQPQWTARESRTADCTQVTRDQCHTCNESRGLVEKVVSGLERLEAELRQVLASTPLGRNRKEVSQLRPN